MNTSAKYDAVRLYNIGSDLTPLTRAQVESRITALRSVAGAVREKVRGLGSEYANRERKRADSMVDAAVSLEMMLGR